MGAVRQNNAPSRRGAPLQGQAEGYALAIGHRIDSEGISKSPAHGDVTSEK